MPKQPLVKQPTKEKAAPPKEAEKKAPPDLSVPIAMGVLAQLGHPKNLHEVQVHHLWDNRYRVNVWVVEKHKKGIYGDDTFGLVIKHSYFIWASPEGGIVNSNPPIQRVYKKKEKPPETVSDELVDSLTDQQQPCAEEEEEKAAM